MDRVLANSVYDCRNEKSYSQRAGHVYPLIIIMAVFSYLVGWVWLMIAALWKPFHGA